MKSLAYRYLTFIRQILLIPLILTLIGLLSACGTPRNSGEPVTQPEATQDVVTEAPAPATGPEEEPAVAQESEPQAAQAESDTLSSAQNPAGVVGLMAIVSAREDDPEAGDIYLMDSDGENLRRLTNEPGRYSLLDWSPDGQTLLWTKSLDKNWDIYAMDEDGTDPRQLTDSNEADMFPDWSPDGRTIAFGSKRDGNWDIYLMAADGSDQRNLTGSPAEENFPNWSPDGTKLAFVSDQAGNQDIYVMNADGNNVIQLTDDPGQELYPKWSPAGTQLIFTSDRDGNRELYLMAADGSNVRRLTNNPAADMLPAWSPDGQTIIWRSDRAGNEEIYAMNPDGSNVRRLTNNPGLDGFAAVQPNEAELIAFGGEQVTDPTASEPVPEKAVSEEAIKVSRISVASDGTEANAPSDSPAVSADGRYVAFESEASNLVDDDTNGVNDIFVHDRETGETGRVSLASGGIEANDSSHAPAISADGRYVAFESQATNLVDEATNGQNNVFVHDRQTGETSLVSVGIAGMPDRGYSRTPTISADGRYVAFASEADHGPREDIYVHDRDTGQTSRISEPLAGLPAESSIFTTSFDPVISADGRYVAFASGAAYLVNNDTNEHSDIFVYNRETGETTRVSVASDGTEANDDTRSPAISADGRYVAFESVANNLVNDDPNYVSDIFVHDRQTGETVRVSADLDKVPEENDRGFLYPTLSGNGRYVAFDGLAPYVYDLQTGQTLQPPGLVSAGDLIFSADRQYLVYASRSSRLIDDDTNNARDIFVQDVSEGLQPLEIEPAGRQSEESIAAAQTTPVSGDTVEMERTLADGLPELPGGFPRLPVPDNVELEQFEGRLDIHYLTSTPVEEVDNLYRTALPAQGWLPESQEYLDFSKEELELGISIEGDETSDKTRVSVNLHFTTPSPNEALSTILVLPDAEFVADLAGQMGESQSYLIPTDVDLDQLAEPYREFYRTRLYDQGWSLTRDRGIETVLLTFERGQSKIDITLGEPLADKFTNYILSSLFYTNTESGTRFAYRERGCFSYLIEQADDLNTTPLPADFDVNGYAADKVSEYEALLSAAIEQGTFELLCTDQKIEAGRTDFEFWTGSDDRFHLSAALKDGTVLWLILVRIDRATNTPTEYLEYRDFNTFRVINTDYAVSTTAEETGLQERVFSPLIEHIEALTSLSVLSK